MIGLSPDGHFGTDGAKGIDGCRHNLRVGDHARVLSREASCVGLEQNAFIACGGEINF